MARKSRSARAQRPRSADSELGATLARAFVKTSTDPFSRAQFAAGTFFRDSSVYSPGTAGIYSLEHSRCPQFSNPDRESGWDNRKPVWDSYIPDMSSSDGRIGQTEPYIKRNSTNAGLLIGSNFALQIIP